MAGRPMDPDEYPPIRRQIYQRIMAEHVAAGNDPIEVAPGSVRMQCALCSIDVAVGPLQQEKLKMLREGDGIVVVNCYICAVVVGRQYAEEIQVRGLDPDR